MDSKSGDSSEIMEEVCEENDTSDFQKNEEEESEEDAQEEEEDEKEEDSDEGNGSCDPEALITVVVQNVDGCCLTFQLKRKRRMKVLMRKACEEFKLDWKKVKFTDMGEAIAMNDTSISLELVDGDTIVVVPQLGTSEG